MSTWNFAAVWEAIAAVAPERDAVVCGNERRTYGELAERAGRLASWLAGRGVGAGDTVAIMLLNRPEYLEAFYASLLVGAAPVNVNYRYGVEEVRYLLDDSDAAVVVHEPQFAVTVTGAIGGRPPGAAGPALLERGAVYERALAGERATGPWRDRAPSGDDLVFIYTGGTTGMPKGVMWRNDDLYVALWQMGRPGTEPPDPLAAVRAGKRAATALPACPLMHGTGLFITLSTLAGGGTAVLVDEVGLDVERVWGDVERFGVQILTIVGDAFARPLLSALDAAPERWDLSSLRAITSSGVTWSPETKRGLLRHLPGVLLLDSLGASEGIMTRSASRAGDEIAPARFAVNERVRVLRESDDREVEPGSGEVGLLAVGGRIPIGYYKDPVKTAKTFRTVGGRRYSIPGDYASVDADGTIRLLGRGSACINTGGEKVFPEEVELVLRSHPAVADCIVVGVPEPRFGEMVVAIVEASHPIGEDELRAHCRERTAGYKTPRHVVFAESLGRAPNGKADYRALRALAADHLAGSDSRG